MAICHKSEIRVYDRTGTTLVATVPASGVSWSKELGGSGFLSATCVTTAAPLASNPTMLDDCVIKLALPLVEGAALVEVLAYANRARNGTLHGGAGVQTREIRQAPTLWTAWAQDAVLHPESNAIVQMSEEQRYFGYQSSIYDPDADTGYTWGTPSAATGQQDSTGGDRAGNPDGWPTALGNAYWITRGVANNGMRHLFVADVTVPTAAYCTVYFSADESCAVYFAGALVIQTSSSETGYQNVDTWSAWVEAGTYRVAIDKTSIVSRGGDGVDPVLLAVATNHDNGSVNDILLVTNNSDWQVFTMDPVEGMAPALTPGEIALQLHSQAAARGVDTWAAITPDFTAGADSASVAWPHREERAWRIGYDTHLDMLEGLGDIAFCPDITPARVFKAWANRGTDRNTTVIIEALVSADSISESGTGVAATVMPVETQDGWVVLENATARAAYGRREQALSLGNAPSIAQGKRLGQEVLDTRLSQPTSEWAVEFYAFAGCVPFQDFDLGDTVGIKIGATTTPRVVLAIGGQADSTEAIIRWTLKTGEVQA